MKNGTVLYQDNFRTAYRGVRQFDNGRIEISLTDKETKNFDFDFTRIMDSAETITSAPFTSDTSQVDGTPVIDGKIVNLTLTNAAASGRAYLLLTLSNGNIKQVELFINVNNEPIFRDYK